MTDIRIHRALALLIRGSKVEGLERWDLWCEAWAILLTIGRE